MDGAEAGHVRTWQRLYYYFLFCAFAGQVYEVLLDNLWYGHPWRWQGPLHGPWLIIYGVGGVALLLMLERLVPRQVKVGGVNLMPLAIAVLIFLIAATIEYIGHWLLDTFFDFRPWDYSAKPLNLNGRTCFEDVLRFTVLGMVELYLAMPLFERGFKGISRRSNTVLCAVLLGVFVLDVVISFGMLWLGSG
jgi:uncharacterized membrane protein